MGTDVDEVLAAFQDGVFGIVERTFGRKMTAYDLSGWDIFASFSPEERAYLIDECERPGFCAHLAPLPGAQDAIKELRKHVDLYAVTSHFHSHTWVSERDWWLHQRFGFKRNQIIHTAAKYLVGTDIFLDDKPEHVVNWKAEHPRGLVMFWQMPNTRDVHVVTDMYGVDHNVDTYRVKDWDDVIRRVVDHKVVL